LKGGVGQAGDAYEQQADAVAEAVVSGESAEPLLEPVQGGSSEGDAGPVQMAPEIPKKTYKKKKARKRPLTKVTRRKKKPPAVPKRKPPKVEDTAEDIETRPATKKKPPPIPTKKPTTQAVEKETPAIPEEAVESPSKEDGFMEEFRTALQRGAGADEIGRMMFLSDIKNMSVSMSDLEGMTRDLRGEGFLAACDLVYDELDNPSGEWTEPEGKDAGEVKQICALGYSAEDARKILDEQKLAYEDLIALGLYRHQGRIPVDEYPDALVFSETPEMKGAGVVTGEVLAYWPDYRDGSGLSLKVTAMLARHHWPLNGEVKDCIGHMRDKEGLDEGQLSQKIGKLARGQVKPGTYLSAILGNPNAREIVDLALSDPTLGTKDASRVDPRTVTRGDASPADGKSGSEPGVLNEVQSALRRKASVKEIAWIINRAGQERGWPKRDLKKRILTILGHNRNARFILEVESAVKDFESRKK